MNKIIDEIKDEEIEYAEKILLPEGEIFDEERRKIIRELGSCSVEACPGSGKTTVLLAKLVILANRMPLKNNKGICVLTHTNVAIEEIKKRLGAKSDILFQYPNYFGTLQSFIDKFLAIPYYKKIFNKNIDWIDNDLAEKINLKIAQKNDKYIASNRNFKNKDISSIYYSFESKKLLIKDKSDNFKTLYKDSTKFLFKEFIKRIESGILKYEEAIELAYIYIRKIPNLNDFFSSRFNLIMVDEMQDTNEMMSKILESIFDSKKTSIQYIGDSNQNIYGGYESWKMINHYTIAESKRYGDSIAKFLCPLRMSREGELKGNTSKNSKIPHMIIYEEGKELEVIDNFIDIIRKLELNKTKEEVFKIIGQVGKERKKGTHKSILSYYPDFIGSSSNHKLSFNSLFEKGKNIKSKNKIKLEALLKSIIGYFKDSNINSEYLSQKKLLEFFESRGEDLSFKYILYNYLRDDDVNRLSNDVFILLEKLDLINEGSKDEFLNYVNPEITGKKSDVNRIKFDDILVQVGTVNSVKGETHTGTLYLETMRYKHDVEYFIEHILLESKPSEIKDSYNLLNKMYVGFSRATDLLCIACRKTEKIEKLIEENQDYVDETFEIIRI